MGKMINFKIKKTDLVLEIGSGHNPYNRSNVLCDKFLFSNKERENFALRLDRPLVIAAGEKLPFKNKVFDFIICRQVIEHSSNPMAFVKEMERVGKRGVVICPQAIRERLFGWRYHKWYIFQKKEKLIFIPKQKHLENHFFHKLYAKKSFFRRFCLKNNQKLQIFYYWQKKIVIEIKRIKPDFQELDNQLRKLLNGVSFNVFKDVLFDYQELNQRLFSKMHKEIRKLIWQIKNRINPQLNLNSLKGLICCPSCHSDLKLGSQIICSKCGKKYKLIKGIPILLT